MCFLYRKFEGEGGGGGTPIRRQQKLWSSSFMVQGRRGWNSKLSCYSPGLHKPTKRLKKPVSFDWPLVAGEAGADSSFWTVWRPTQPPLVHTVILHSLHQLVRHTDKKKTKFSSYIRKFRVGSGATSYMRIGFLIYEEMRKFFSIYEKAVSHIWLYTPSLYFIVKEVAIMTVLAFWQIVGRGERCQFQNSTAATYFLLLFDDYCIFTNTV